LGWRFYRHRQISFPPRDSVHVRFHEGTASGSSNKNFFTRLGGANHCLRVTVTDEEIWVRSYFLLDLIVDVDLRHRIPRESVTSAQLAESRFGRRVLLDFRLPDGGSRRLSLHLRDPGRFLIALEGPPPLPLTNGNAINL
jgi:hypothetical protein